MSVYLFLEMIAYFFHYLTIKRLFIIKKSYFTHAVLLFISFLLVSMIIYIGDWGNLPPTLLIYLAGIQYACEGSRAKKFALSLMLSSTIFAYNAFLDNVVLIVVDFPLIFMLRILFSVLLYLIIRFRGPDAETELGNSLWHLMLLLTLAPIGIVLSIVLIPKEYFHIPGWLLLLYTVLLFIALFYLIGLLWTITVLAKQRKLEQKNLYAEMNQK